MPETAEPSFEAFLEEAYDIRRDTKLHTNIIEKGVIATEGGEVHLTILQADAEKFYGDEKGYEVTVLNTYTDQIIMRAAGPNETLKITLKAAPRGSATYEVEKIK